VDEFYLLTKPEYSGPAPTREPPPIPATAPSSVVVPPPDVEPAPIIVSSPVTATNLPKSQPFDSPTEKELTIDDIEDFEDDEDEFDGRRASRRHQTDASDLSLLLPLFETGTSYELMNNYPEITCSITDTDEVLCLLMIIHLLCFRLGIFWVILSYHTRRVLFSLSQMCSVGELHIISISNKKMNNSNERVIAPFTMINSTTNTSWEKYTNDLTVKTWL
jgi:hypothetical protein